MRGIFSVMLFLILFSVQAQSLYPYASSDDHPFGQPNPDAPEQIKDFAGMIGTCECKSVSRISQTAWADTVSMVWTYRYIMNGWAVQDETLKADGKHSGSIRQYNADSSKWYVHYYASATASPVLSVWEGNKQTNGNILLYKDQLAPNGFEGYFRITFHNITSAGYNWTGEWVDKTETVIYPTWRIFCRRKSG